jgi:hypothetical protein
MPLDRLLLARIGLTLVSIGSSALTVKADFNKSHATNPPWRTTTTTWKPKWIMRPRG